VPTETAGFRNSAGPGSFDVIYLHIGRHKTGTTAIQRFLSANRDRLEAYGFTYPPTGSADDAHHGVWMALRQRAGSVRQPLSSPGLAPSDLQEFSQLLAAAPNAIVSSEAFQNLNPADIVDVFPPGQTTILVYLREQLDYLVSAYSQSVQAELELRSVAEFVRDVPLHYGPFLDAWARVFGRDHLVVKLYDRGRLKHGDVIDDFMDTLGVGNLDTFVRPDGDANVSLSALLTSTKRLLNRVLTPEQHREWRLYGRFGQLASRCTYSGRVTLDNRASEALRQEYRVDNAYVSQRYFDSSEDVFHYAPAPEAAPATTSEVLAMLDALEELAPDAHRLLIETVMNDDLVKQLPEDERTLATMIHRLRGPGIATCSA
jgi:hypothetical protein